MRLIKLPSEPDRIKANPVQIISKFKYATMQVQKITKIIQ